MIWQNFTTLFLYYKYFRFIKVDISIFTEKKTLFSFKINRVYLKMEELYVQIFFLDNLFCLYLTVFTSFNKNCIFSCNVSLISRWIRTKVEIDPCMCDTTPHATRGTFLKIGKWSSLKLYINISFLKYL